MARPDWIQVRYNENRTRPVADYIETHGISTVCEGALCPNRWTCYPDKEITFMILGGRCTRACGFCGVEKGAPGPVDAREHEKILDAVGWLGGDYAVITSVTRDDLQDNGAGRFVKVIESLKGRGVHVEVLIPDFNGREELIKTVVDAQPDVIAHNMETVESHYRRIRPLSDYHTSLSVLETVKRVNKDAMTKSGLMLGFGEDVNEVKGLIRDIRETGCDMLTIGQYLKPLPESHDVVTYVHPEVFRMLEEYSYELGFKAVRSGPFVRSSLHAKEMWEQARRLDSCFVSSIQNAKKSPHPNLPPRGEGTSLSPRLLGEG